MKGPVGMPVGRERGRSRSAGCENDRICLEASGRSALCHAFPAEAGAHDGPEARTADLLAEMCHEIRSPVGSLILAAIRLSETAGLAAECRRDADRVRIAAEHLVTLLDDLLFLHAVDVHDGERTVPPVDLRLLLQELFLLLELKAEAVSARLHLAIDPDAPVVVACDRGWISQIVMNLVDNAIRHAGCSNIVMAVTAARDGWCHLRIEDDGRGLDDHRRQRVSGSQMRWGAASGGGAGLGLRICGSLVERLGGALSFDDRAGGGLCVTVTLPIAIARHGDAS